MANYYDFIDSTLEKTRKSLDESGKKQKEENTRHGEETIAKAEKNNAEQIDKTTDDYLDIMRSADIQKELDLRDIRETRANMGLSRSGLSATEQTAAILSAGNKTAEAQRNRQQAIDALSQSLLEYKNQVDAEVRSKNLAIDAGIDKQLASQRTDLIKQANELTSKDEQAAIKAETDRIKSNNELAIKKIEANNTKEKNRKSDLKSLLDVGAINEDTYTYAFTNGLSAAQAVEFEKKPKTNLEDLYTEFADYNRRWRRQGYTKEQRQKYTATYLKDQYKRGEIDASAWAELLNYYGIDEYGNAIN